MSRSAWVVRRGSSTAKLRLFCFPYAGAGAGAFRGWSERLPGEVELCLLQPPGRETRFREPAPANLETLIENVVEHTQVLRDLPFALFGHSLGALVAFELTRALRRQGAPLPVQLFVSAATAPQLRDTDPPIAGLADAELRLKLRGFAGTPAALLEDPQMMDVLLPLLRADLGLRDAYRYQVEAPLPVPICAYGGQADPHVSMTELSAWREQTSGGFGFRGFAGGHFFIHTARDAFLRDLGADLQPLLGSAGTPCTPTWSNAHE